MIEAILWDNDGVLVDTERLFFEATKSAFARLGLHLTEEVWAARYLGEGRGSGEIARDLGGDPHRIGPVLDERNQRYLQILQQAPPIRPRVRETLMALPDRAKMAIVTGCHRHQLHLMHDSSGLLEFFDVIVTGDDCTYSKPHPEPYLTATKALDICAGNCVAVEDSQRGLASATAAGVACVVVPSQLTRTLDFAGALAVEQDVSGVLKHILKC